MHLNARSPHPRTVRATRSILPVLILTLLGCSPCNEGAEGDGLEQRGSVANAPNNAATVRTNDGYEVIASRRQVEAPRPSHDNLMREPDSPDPHEGRFLLEEAVEGMPTDGQLVAEFNTTFGTFFCDLYAERVPNTVANFIGLARGKRAWWDARMHQWRNAPAYENTQIFRVMPEYLIQGGDYLDDGTGTIGYTIPAEPHSELRHDRAGQLCMATTGPNEGGAQFFITDGAAPQLDNEEDQHTIFGQCRPLDMLERLARVPQGEENRPLTPIVLRRIRIRRVVGGAANARVTPPRLPDGVRREDLGREASPGPSTINLTERQREEIANEEDAERAARIERLRALRSGQVTPR